jgi:hypothetical protein
MQTLVEHSLRFRIQDSPHLGVNSLCMQDPLSDSSSLEQLAYETLIVALVDSTIKDLLNDVVRHVMQEIITWVFKKEILRSL